LAGEAGLDPVIVVVADADPHLPRLLPSSPGVHLVETPPGSTAQGDSLLTGLRAVPTAIDRAAVLLGDMPFVPPAFLRRLLEVHTAGDHRATATARDDRPMPPLILERCLFERVGDPDRARRRAALRSLGPALGLVPADPAMLVDLDTPADYAQARRRVAPPPDRAAAGAA
jgi:CTP:molybdopterin cytidylyltransferase MocA